MVMKTFKDLVFKVRGGENIHAVEKFDNGFSISVVAGEVAYSTPRKNMGSADDFSSFEVAILNDEGRFTRKFFPDHHDDVLGWQERGQINALMLLVQNA
jgi:hypothetical protein